MSGDKKTVGFRSEFFRGRHRRGYMRGKQGVFSKFRDRHNRGDYGIFEQKEGKIDMF